jgi:hypothetical protein
MTTEDRWVQAFVAVAITTVLTTAICHYMVTRMELESKLKLIQLESKNDGDNKANHKKN